MSIVLLLSWLAACGGSPAPKPTSVAPPPEVAEPAPDAGAEADAAAVQQARDAMKQLGGTLKGRLVEVMGGEGPVAAATVCADEAQQLTADLAEKTGVKVGRSSLRLRNPGNAAPSWVQEWLAAQGERAAEGVQGSAEVVQEGERRVARVLAPLPVEAPCVACHGPRDALSEDVLGVLAARYPDDAATGYAVGDLRGAIWAEAVVSR